MVVLGSAAIAPPTSSNKGIVSSSFFVYRFPLKPLFALNPLAQQAKERQLANLKQNQKEATVVQIIEQRIEEIPEVKESDPIASAQLIP